MMECRALSIGINYLQSDQGKLQGCINDATFISDVLHGVGYDVVTLRDDDRLNMPTAYRILCELVRLVAWAKQGAGRKIVVHFSGHGVGLRDRYGNDETDGKDEFIVACDNNIIRDDDMNAILQLLPADATALFIVDCCHSGSMLDLKYSYRGRHGVVDASVKDVCANVILLSGCTDSQTSADTIDLRPEYQCYSGAMTSALLFSLRYCTTFKSLISIVRFVLRRRGYSQVPQLTASFECAEDMSLTGLLR